MIDRKHHRLRESSHSCLASAMDVLMCCSIRYVYLLGTLKQRQENTVTNDVVYGKRERRIRSTSTDLREGCSVKVLLPFSVVIFGV